MLLLLPRGSISWFIDHGILGAIIFIAIVVIVSLVMTGHVDLGGTQVYTSSSEKKGKTETRVKKYRCGGAIFYDRGSAEQYSRMLREKKIYPNDIEEIY